MRFLHTTKFQALVVVLALLTLPGEASAELYYNQRHRFSIDAPTGWAVKNSTQPYTIVKFVHRDREGNIAVLSIAADDESWLGALIPLTADRMYDGFKDEYRDFTVRRLASGTTKIRSMDSVWNLIEITDPPQARIIGKHYHLRRNGKLWRISAMTDSGKAFFETVLPAMEKSIATLAFGL